MSAERAGLVGAQTLTGLPWIALNIGHIICPIPNTF